MMGLPELPDDMADAFDSMKLAILRHRYEGWREISSGDAIEALAYLLALAMEKDPK